MSRTVAIAALVAGAIATTVVLWWFAGDLLAPLGDWAAQKQRGFQNRIAGALRALRAGQPGALSLLMLVCFAYGFFHAVGPGHGKVLIGGYGMARSVPWRRLSLVALLSSLGQAVTAVVLVYGAITIFQLGRDGMIGLAENTMAPVSYGAIAAIGLWLGFRGLRGLLRLMSPVETIEHGKTCSHDHGRDHGHVEIQGQVEGTDLHRGDHHGQEETCHHCGHRHGPSAAEVEGLTNWREGAVLIAGIAARPCTGALFVLVITWQMGIALAGVAGAFAMALGTASVTIAVGLAALGLRGSALSFVAGAGRLRQVGPLLELAAGLLIALIATGLLLRSLP